MEKINNLLIIITSLLFVAIVYFVKISDQLNELNKPIKVTPPPLEIIGDFE